MIFEILVKITMVTNLLNCIYCFVKYEWWWYNHKVEEDMTLVNFIVYSIKTIDNCFGADVFTF